MNIPVKLLLFLFLAFLSVHAFGQAYPINGGDVSTCSGALLDSGGQGGSGYSNNEHFTITICPGQPDSSISLSFVIFNLSAAGSLPTDQLTIFDGNSTSAPVLGTWSGTDSPGIVHASFANASGCLTVEFTSNEMGTGVFAAGITCSKPCEPPTAVAVMSEVAPALICQGEALSFDGSASTAAGGYTIAQFLWDFGDGTLDSTSGPVLNHVFIGPPGQHVVHLTVTDDNACENINPVDLPVQISTTPTFQGFDNITHCAGEPVDLTAATSVTGTTWTSIPDANFGGGMVLPDNVGTPFSSSLNFTAFPPGATLTNINQLLSVCISMEHSFMGDFVLQLTSPSGVTVVFHEQYGGGTYLGIPNDNDEGNPQIGTCWEYCFSPTATNGTWVDNSGGGTSLPAGTYESLNPMSAFVGSPLNGTWTLTFTDLWAIDNGFICSWGINFDPSILPDDVAYTPIPGIAHSDSSYWTGPALSNDPLNPLHYIADPLTVGPNVYTYTVTDNFGCTYDTTLTINITPGVHFDVSSAPPAVCGDPILLQPGLVLPLPTGTITYQWSPPAGLSSTSSPFPTASPTVPTWYTLHAFPAGHPLCGMVDSVLIQPLTTMANDSLVVDALCHGDGTGSIQVVTTGDGGPWDYTWTNSSGTVVRTTTASNGDTFQGAGGTYKVVIQEGANGNGCSDSLMATIHEPPPLLLADHGTDTTICRTGTAALNATATGGTGPAVLHWDHGVGIGPVQTASPLQTTTYSVYATDAHNCYSDTAMVVITVRPGLGAELVDTVMSCPNVDVMLQLDTVFGGNGQYNYDWGTGVTASDSLIVNLSVTQNFCVTIRDGCETPPMIRCATVAITPVPPLELTVDSVLGCSPFIVHFSMNDTTSAATADWNFGYGPTQTERPMALTHVYDQYGTFNVRVNVHWPNGCSVDSTYSNLIKVIDQPLADFNWTPYPATILHNEVHFHELATDIADTFEWYFAGLDSSLLPDPVFTFPNDLGRNYPVRLIVRNYLGCADTIWKLVNVEDVFMVYVPTAFTPDGDGLNEVLYVEGNDIADQGFHFMVFDRWGEKIYDTTDRHAGWEGKLNGKVVKNGVYTWMLRAQSVYNGVNHDLRGHVNVVR